MMIEPKTRGFICTTAHPAGCYENVRLQAEYVKSRPPIHGKKRVLVIGASTGYGLASRIASAFGCGAATLGVIFDKPAAGSRTATAGWYNTAAFERLAAQEGLYAKTVNGDGFSSQVKEQVMEHIRSDLGKVDMVVYSLAAPRRTMPDGAVYSSVLKTVGQPYTNKTIDLKSNTVSQVTVPSATPEEVEATVKVMGGEDWMDWMAALSQAGLLEEDAVTLAYSYIGPALTHAIYLDGSIGQAKAHLYQTACRINQRFPGVRAYISVNKALVTQSSAAIPIVPLYISILYKVMKERGVHEDCIQQIDRMYRDLLFVPQPVTDEKGRLRPDNLELDPQIQQEVSAVWERITTESIRSDADIGGYWEDFFRMFGFGLPGVDYTLDQDPQVEIPSLSGREG